MMTSSEIRDIEAVPAPTLPPLAEARPVFVVGTPRSGTTLTANILDRHGQIHKSAETHFFEYVWGRTRNNGPLTDAELADAAGRTMGLFDTFAAPHAQAMVDAAFTQESLMHSARKHGGDYRGLYYAFMQTLTRRHDKVRFMDNTPKHIFYLDTIFAFFPNAQVIACVRDPRAFLCSYKNMWQVRGSEAISRRRKERYHPILASMLWRTAYGNLFQAAGSVNSARILPVRYEQLVQTPDEEVRRICDFLEIEYDESLLDVQATNSSFAQEQRGIYASSLERWRTCLDPAEIWWSQRINGSLMTKLGYDLTETGAAAQQIAAIGARLPKSIARYFELDSRGTWGSASNAVRRRMRGLAGR